MKIERYLFVVACALLQSAAPVFSSEQQEQAVALASSEEDRHAVAVESDARDRESGVSKPLRGSASAMPGLMDAISSSSEGGDKRKLTIHIDKVTNLKSSDTFGKSDVFVELTLKNAGKLIGEGETPVVKDLNPAFDQDFTFSLPQSNPTKNVVLQLMVMDEDAVFNDKMGETEIKLDDLSLSSTPTVVARKVNNYRFAKDPEIYLSIALEDPPTKPPTKAPTKPPTKPLTRSPASDPRMPASDPRMPEPRTPKSSKTSKTSKTSKSGKDHKDPDKRSSPTPPRY